MSSQQHAAEPEDEEMTTQIRRQVSGAARVAAVGLLSLGAVAAFAQNARTVAQPSPALIGQIEVTARALHVAASAERALPAIESIPVIGHMTVTATRLPSFAQQNKQPDSAGETPARNRSPRAVLVQ